MQQQKSLPKKGKSREDITMSMLDKFTKKVKTALTDDIDEDPAEEEEEDDWSVE